MAKCYNLSVKVMRIETGLFLQNLFGKRKIEVNIFSTNNHFVAGTLYKIR